jgi:hypothetical protein
MHICLIVDACFSGDILNISRGKPEEITSEYFYRAYKRTSRQVLTSGGLESVPDRSEFTFLLLRALTYNTSPYIDPLMLFEEIRLGMSKTTPLLGELKQTGHQDGASFLLFLKDKIPDSAEPLDPEEGELLSNLEEKSEKSSGQEEKDNTSASQARENSRTENEKIIDKPDNMVYVRGGSFLMGNRKGIEDEWPVHEVTVGDFYQVCKSVDPAGPNTGSKRVLRGGSWYNSHQYVTVSARGYSKPKSKDDYFGFRLVRTNR